MWNTIREFFRKKDKELVAVFVTGNRSIFKDGVPYTRIYYCWEDDTGKRSYDSTGIGSKDKFTEDALAMWKFGILNHIPSYYDMVDGRAVVITHQRMR